MKVLLFGASGMLGHTAFDALSRTPGIEVWGTVRAARAPLCLEKSSGHILHGVDVGDPDALMAAFQKARPDVVINCVGVVKQLESSKDPLAVIPLNAMVPHRLARLSKLVDARLIHVSTDCVFSGSRGGYSEADTPDAEDLYGRSKLLGEAVGENSITLRTSIIGHEIATQNGLVEWFLAQTGNVRGFTKAFFSGVTTNELSRIIIEHVLPNPALSGLWHVASHRISKHDLLALVREEYERDDISITPSEELVIDRSLNAERFRRETGYTPPTWREMIAAMKQTNLDR